MKKLLTATAISVALGLTSAAAIAETTHEVKPGETLHLISMQYGLGWKKVADANGLDDPNGIEAGMTLTIPAGGYRPTSSSKSSRGEVSRSLSDEPLKAIDQTGNDVKAGSEETAAPDSSQTATRSAQEAKSGRASRDTRPVAPPPPSGTVDRRASANSGETDNSGETEPAVTQMFEVKPDATVEVEVAKGEVNRIAIQGGKIEDVFGASEALLIEADKKRGQVFVRFAEDDLGSRGSKQSSLFISDDRGATYTVVMHPTNRSSTSVVLRPTFGQLPGNVENKRVTGDTYPYQSRIMALVKTMFLNKSEDGLFDATERGTELTRWDGLPMLLVREWSGDGLNGREFFVQNMGDKPLMLMEADFAVKGVLAVSMTDHEVEPGESSRVFVIHQNLEER